MAPVEPTGTEPVSASAAPLTVEVAVSIAPRQVQRVRLQVPAGSTVRDKLIILQCRLKFTEQTSLLY